MRIQAMRALDDFNDAFGDQIVTIAVPSVQQLIDEITELSAGGPRDCKVMLLEIFLMKAVDAILEGKPDPQSLFQTSLQHNLAYLGNNNYGIGESDVHPTILAEARKVVK